MLFCLFKAVWIACSWKLLYMGHSNFCLTKPPYFFSLLQFCLLGKIKLHQLDRCQEAFIWMCQVFIGYLNCLDNTRCLPFGKAWRENWNWPSWAFCLDQMGMPFPWICNTVQQSSLLLLKALGWMMWFSKHFIVVPFAFHTETFRDQLIFKSLIGE